MAISRANTPPDPVFVVDGEPVLFYLWTADDHPSGWALSEGARAALQEKIEVGALSLSWNRT